MNLGRIAASDMGIFADLAMSTDRTAFMSAGCPQFHKSN